MEGKKGEEREREEEKSLLFFTEHIVIIRVGGVCVGVSDR
jgi:hypothetical protein